MSHSLFDFNPFRHCNHLIKCCTSFLLQHSQSVICHSPAVTAKKYDCLMILELRNMMLALAFQIIMVTYCKPCSMVPVYLMKEKFWDQGHSWFGGKRETERNDKFTLLPYLTQKTINKYLVSFYFFQVNDYKWIIVSK